MKRTSLSPGDQLGRYEIKARLGAGGMGDVYLARDTKLGRTVALKILPADFAADRNSMQRFIQEAKTASALNHPNIITIHEIEEANSIHFIAAEFIKGETLRQLMSRQPLTITEALEMAIQVASALTAAHQAGIVHRDIKPENIMVREDGYVKVLDFGLAKFIENQPATSVDTQAATKALINTEPGVVMGTTYYMSPEQARGLGVDGRTDIWSLGCVLYEMLARHPPFTGATTTDIIAAIVKTTPAPLTPISPDIPDKLEEVVFKALEKDREERYQGVQDLLVDLRRLKKRIDFETELDRSRVPEASSGDREKQASQQTSSEQTVIIDAPETLEAERARRTSSASRIVSRIKQHKRSFAIAALIVLLAAIGLGYWFFIRSSANASPIQSIAVLPFVNESGNTDVEYLSDGITESLINNLSQLPNLTVKARSSVFRYKGKEVEAQAVGRELGVEALLLGRMTQRGDDLTLSLELVDARTGNHLWGEQYVRKLNDLVAVQSELARDVLEKLRRRLTSADEQRATKSYTASTEAYQLYLKGNYYLNKLTEEGYQRSVDFFRQATERDPNYALAYAGLANAYLSMISHSVRPAEEVLPLAKAAATKALQLDDTLAEAHTESADIKLRYDWDWAGAESAFNQALRLNPNYAEAHHSYAYYLISRGRMEEAFAEIKRAQELDPLSLSINTDYGEIYYFARRPDEAIAQLKKALELDASFVRAHFLLGRAYAQKGQCAESLSEFQKAKELDPDSVEMLAALDLGYAWCGSKEEGRKALDDLLALANRRYVSPHLIAVIYAALGDKEKGFEWLDKAFEKHFTALIYLKVNPIWDPLRSDPRFAERLRRVGLPQ
jgi:eukaryotic-like serine/threonine-protein kinase